MTLPGSFGHVLCHRPDHWPGGFALYQIAGDMCEVLTIAVIPDLRRQGAAAALMRAGEEVLTAQSGIEKWMLEVARDNSAAQALYTAMGFKNWGVRKNYYMRPDKKSVDALVLGKYLSG